MWDIDSYDQWGVELGKVLAKKVRTILSEPDNKAQLSTLNSATRDLLQLYLSKRT